MPRRPGARAARGRLKCSRPSGRPCSVIDGRSMEEIVGQLLLDGKRTISAAESCTGGLMMSRLTDVPGSSAYVLGGVVAYSNAVKIELVGVRSGTDRGARRRQRTSRGGSRRRVRARTALIDWRRHHRYRRALAARLRSLLAQWPSPSQSTEGPHRRARFRSSGLERCSSSRRHRWGSTWSDVSCRAAPRADSRARRELRSPLPTVARGCCEYH